MKRNKKFLKRFAISRTTILIVLFAFLSLILMHRLFTLQIIDGQEYADNFSLMTTKTRTLKGTRGNIYDRNGQLLAYNQLSYSVTLEDNGTYKNTREKNLALNGEIYKLIQIIEKNGDEINSDFHIVLDENGNYTYDVSGVSLSRFKADVYGYTTIDKLKEEEASASAEKMMEDLMPRNRFGLIDKEPYTKEELSAAGLPEEISKSDILKIFSVRYSLFTTSFRKYVPVTVATDVNEETVAAILEKQTELQGVDIAEDSIRVYDDSVYFANIIGYTGKVSADELADLKTEYPDAGYSATSIVGKAGIEKEMESYLQGTEGSETVYVDYLGKVLEIDDASRVEPAQGNDIHLTIDKDLQIACYKVLEQKIAGILVQNIRDIKTFVVDDETDASGIPIPIYDVYFALVNNSIIDISHFTKEDASETEQKVQRAFEEKQQAVFAQVRQELTGANPLAYCDLSKEYQGYFSYIVNELLMKKTGILSETAIDKNDAIYKAWTKEERISLQEYLTYATSQNWIDMSQFSDESAYLDATEVYDNLATYIAEYLTTDKDFSKMLYKYMLLDDVISGRDLCQILYDQGILSMEDSSYADFSNGSFSAMELMLEKISNLEIKPSQLALDPCSGSIVIVNPNTGETLACVSYPGYDNNRLANQMDADYYRQLNSDLSNPFYNKATQERTAPGSTYKPIMAIAGLSEGVITETSMIVCDGNFDKLQGESLACWLRTGHGALSLIDGIAKSCNEFFSEISYMLGTQDDGTFSSSKAMEKITAYAELFHMDQKSGLEIPEAEPQVSDQLPIPSAIGQGTHNYTTSQLARYVTTLASSGKIYEISLLDKVTDSNNNILVEYTPEVVGNIELSQSIWDDIHAGMEGVITDSNWGIFQDLQVTLAGKTGTAQQSKSRPNHGLFIGYAPAEQPEIAWAVRIANGYTSTNAELVAKDVLNYYFGLKDETEILTGQATSASNSNSQTD